MILPVDHPQRLQLNDEAHARSPEALEAPVRISYLALYPNRPDHAEDLEPLRELAADHGIVVPDTVFNYYSADFGSFRIKWERHTEFTRYTFFVPGEKAAADPFAQTASNAAPAGWLKRLPGQTIVAAHVALVEGEETPIDADAISGAMFNGNHLVGAQVGGGLATALTDFRIGADGFTRMLVLDRGMASRQAGRMIQRLLEIETYRMMALLALPVARQLGPFLTECQRELAQTMEAMASAREDAETALLDRLIRLEAGIEAHHSDNQYRFSAAAAYYELVRRRILELREQRIEGLQSFQEFTERRLAPAMNTCQAMAARQEALSERVSRANQLLSTRVDLTRQRQNQAVLESMNRRARLQLRLQQTVEGLSIAAVTYYVVGLTGYALKGISAAGLNVNTDLAIGICVPIIAIMVALGISQVRMRMPAMMRRLRPW